MPSEHFHRLRRATVAAMAMSTVACGAPPRRSARDTASAPAVARVAAGPTVLMATAAQAEQMAPGVAPALAHRVDSAEQSALARLPAGSGHDLVIGNCIICHSAAMIEQQHKDTDGWNKTVTQMRAWGAPLSAAQQPVLVAYLAKQFPARADGPVARPVP